MRLAAHEAVPLTQNADPWIEVDGGITPANAYKVLEPSDTTHVMPSTP